jgi:two-component system CheB/CheR fusion protein
MANTIQVGDVEQTSAPLARVIAKVGEPLIEGDNFFRDLVDALPVAIYTTDAAGRITYFNDAAAALWGCRPELGKNEWCGSWRLYWPDGRPLPHDECPMAVALRAQHPVRGQEAVAERPDGTRVPFLPYPTPIYNSAGVMIGAVNMLVDLSDWKRAEGGLLHFAAIVESSDDAIVSKNLDGIITSWNPGAERIFGYRADEMIGRSIKTLIPEHLHSEEDTILARIRAGQRIEHYETVRQRKYGGLVEISLTISPIKNADGVIIGASKIARDISERKRNEAQIAMLAREAEHRVKNVLATVQATIHLTQADTPDLMKKAIEGRIQALANVHALFVKSRWTGAELRTLVTQELLPYSEAGDTGNTRVEIDGPPVFLETSTAQTIAVALHELTTNAAKYGALSVAAGRVRVEWEHSAGDHLSIRWTETGGPAAEPPTRKGFGTRVMEAMIGGQLKGGIEFDWRSEGLACHIKVPDGGTPPTSHLQ